MPGNGKSARDRAHAGRGLAVDPREYSGQDQADVDASDRLPAEPVFADPRQPIQPH